MWCDRSGWNWKKNLSIIRNTADRTVERGSESEIRMKWSFLIAIILFTLICLSNFSSIFSPSLRSFDISNISTTFPTTRRRNKLLIEPRNSCDTRDWRRRIKKSHHRRYSTLTHPRHRFVIFPHSSLYSSSSSSAAFSFSGGHNSNQNESSHLHRLTFHNSPHQFSPNHRAIINLKIEVFIYLTQKRLFRISNRGKAAHKRESQHKNGEKKMSRTANLIIFLLLTTSSLIWPDSTLISLSRFLATSFISTSHQPSGRSLSSHHLSLPHCTAQWCSVTHSVVFMENCIFSAWHSYCHSDNSIPCNFTTSFSVCAIFHQWEKKIISNLPYLECFSFVRRA